MNDTSTIIALGFFDGVHLGHGDLLARTAALAARHGWKSAALTFDRSPGKQGGLLTSVTDRTRLIRENYGVDEVLVLPFTEEFKHRRWDDFLETLVREHGAAHLVCGWDYRFGCRGEGTPDLLRGWCDAHGLGCDVIAPRIVDGVTVSSTFLKTLIAAGETERALRYYGHPHVLSGTVQPGRQLGRTLGFPTANLLPEPDVLLPKAGVYAVRAELDGRTLPGVCNVGTRPTVGGHRATVETWIAGFDGDLYGQTLRVCFYRFLRPEQTFRSLAALTAQVQRDREAAMEYFRQR